MLSQQIRNRFLAYFREQQHLILPSSSLLPIDDPSLLFTNSGMNQFKDLFLGTGSRNYRRVSTVQKCMRAGGKHNDLDQIGHTNRHLTFFEMMGNFSFGDYFKEEAIQFAWEVTLNLFEFSAEQIWVTIFRNDEEAFELWKKKVPERRIVRMDEKDNFWSMGEVGPCGPCSELYYDRGPKYGSASSIDPEGVRYVEFWNLVFMQFNRNEDGSLTPLPHRSIDTGCGLERIVALKMDLDNIFLTDLLRPLIAAIETIAQIPYNREKSSIAFNIIADHIRSLSFAIADGIEPSNNERGYLVRKLLRRAVRQGKSIGIHEPFLAQLVPTLIAIMGDDYPELKAAQSHICDLLTREEESFFRTLKRGGNLLSLVIEEGKSRAEQSISATEAFKLKDTYGFPLEEILLIAKDNQLQVDEKGFHILEEEARNLSKKSKTSHPDSHAEYQKFLSSHPAPEFVGYELSQTETTIAAIVVEGKMVPNISSGEEGILILKRTPFYAERGGQQGDHGTISQKDNRFEVSNCTLPYPSIIAHIGRSTEGVLHVGDQVEAAIDLERRRAIQNNHTATHLLHSALGTILGAEVRQAGSHLDDSKIRFDFNYHRPISPEEIEKIEKLVNQQIRNNSKVATYLLPYEEAEKRADIKQFFGDKYGPIVRVVDLENSKELCGGTHTEQTGTIGYFRITKEASISAGVRRIEACTGREAELFAQKEKDQLEAKMRLQIEEKRKIEELLQETSKKLLKEIARSSIATAENRESHLFLAIRAPLRREELPLLAQEIALQLSTPSIVAVASSEGSHLLLKVSPQLTHQGINAAAIIQKAVPSVGGAGGGRADSAQAGGFDPLKTDQLLEAIRLHTIQNKP